MAFHETICPKSNHALDESVYENESWRPMISFGKASAVNILQYFLGTPDIVTNVTYLHFH